MSIQFSFNEAAQQFDKEYNLGKGEYFKIKDGDNKIRIVSTPIAHESTYMGTPSFKWLCQVIDRTDGKIKPFFMPRIIFKAIGELQADSEYQFDSIPMPYDITIKASNAGQKEAKYVVIPARNSTPLTEEEEAALKAAPTVHELQQRIYEKNREEDQANETQVITNNEGDPGFNPEVA